MRFPRWIRIYCCAFLTCFFVGGTSFAVEETPSIFTESNCLGSVKLPAKPTAMIPLLPSVDGPIGPPPPPPPECEGAVGAATVNPSNFRGAVGSLSGSQTLVLAPGRYPGLNITGKTFSNATIQCAEPGKCIFGSSDIVRVRGLTIDGVTIQGSNVGINVLESQNITIRCSTFIRQTSSGILIKPGHSTEQIAIDKNVFYNDRLGCNYVTGDCSGHLSDGSPVAEMDYGVRAYDARGLYIRGNIFGSLFDHAISLKYGVKYAAIDGNTFNSCGRICIQLGQEPNTVPKGYRSCGEAVVTNNTLSGQALRGILIQNIEKVTMKNNSNTVSGQKIFAQPGYSKCNTNTGGCPLLGNGQPANRQIINN